MHIHSMMRGCIDADITNCAADANFVTCYSYCAENLCNNLVNVFPAHDVRLLTVSRVRSVCVYVCSRYLCLIPMTLYWLIRSNQGSGNQVKVTGKVKGYIYHIDFFRKITQLEKQAFFNFKQQQPAKAQNVRAIMFQKLSYSS